MSKPVSLYVPRACLSKALAHRLWEHTVHDRWKHCRFCVLSYYLIHKRDKWVVVLSRASNFSAVFSVVVGLANNWMTTYLISKQTLMFLWQENSKAKYCCIRAWLSCVWTKPHLQTYCLSCHWHSHGHQVFKACFRVDCLTGEGVQRKGIVSSYLFIQALYCRLLYELHGVAFNAIPP